MLTRPTPLSWEILGARRVSTRSSTCESGMELEVTAKVSTGASAGFVFLLVGGAGGLGGGKNFLGFFVGVVLSFPRVPFRCSCKYSPSRERGRRPPRLIPARPRP